MVRTLELVLLVAASILVSMLAHPLHALSPDPPSVIVESWRQELPSNTIVEAAALDPASDTLALVLSSRNAQACRLDLVLIDTASGDKAILDVAELGNSTMPCDYTTGILAGFNPDGRKLAVSVVASLLESPSAVVSSIREAYIIVVDLSTGSRETARIDVEYLSEGITGLAWAGTETIVIAGNGVIAAYKSSPLSIAWTIDIAEMFFMPTRLIDLVVEPACNDTVLVVNRFGTIIGIGPEGIRWAIPYNGLLLADYPISKSWCIDNSTALVYLGDNILFKVDIADGSIAWMLDPQVTRGFKARDAAYIPGYGVFLYGDTMIALYDLYGNMVAEALNDYSMSRVRAATVVGPEGSLVAVAGYRDGNLLLQVFEIREGVIYRIVDGYVLGSAASPRIWLYQVHDGIVAVFNHRGEAMTPAAVMLAYNNLPVVILTKEPDTRGTAIVSTEGYTVTASLDAGRISVAIPVYPGQASIILDLMQNGERIDAVGPLREYLEQTMLEYTVTVGPGEVVKVPVKEVIEYSLGRVAYTPPPGIQVSLEFTYLAGNEAKGRWIREATESIMLLAVPGSYLVSLNITGGEPIAGGTPPPSLVKIEVEPNKLTIINSSLGLARLIIEGKGIVIISPLSEGENTIIHVDGGKRELWIAAGAYTVRIEADLDLRVIGPGSPSPGGDIRLEVKPGEVVVLNLEETLESVYSILRLENPGGKPVVVLVAYEYGGEENSPEFTLGPRGTERVYLVPGVEYRIIVRTPDGGARELAAIQAIPGETYTVKLIIEEDTEERTGQTHESVDTASEGRDTRITQPGGTQAAEDGEREDDSGEGLSRSGLSVAVLLLAVLALIAILVRARLNRYPSGQ